MIFLSYLKRPSIYKIEKKIIIKNKTFYILTTFILREKYLCSEFFSYHLRHPNSLPMFILSKYSLILKWDLKISGGWYTVYNPIRSGPEFKVPIMSDYPRLFVFAICFTYVYDPTLSLLWYFPPYPTKNLVIIPLNRIRPSSPLPPTLR